MRYTPAYPEVAIPGMLDPPRMVRWVWLGRAALACAILVAAVFVWERAEPADTLVATLAFAGALLATVASATWAEVWRRPVGRPFYLLQCAVDLLLVTAVVHITGGWSSQFAALYILVIATAALLLPFGDGVLVAAAGSVLYALDVLWFRGTTPHLGIWVQLGVFVVVALGSGVIATRLRQAGAGRDALAAQLVQVQLEAAEILRTIQSGLLTVDERGRLLYANPAAHELLGMPLRAFVGRPVLGPLAAVAPEMAEYLATATRDGTRRARSEGVVHREGQLFQIGLATTVGERTPTGGYTATALFQDIPDSKRLQAMHVRTQRLQAVAELSASLAHEIKNPLASIRSSAEQLARRHARRADADEDEQALFGLVLRESDRLSRLLSEFLDFARPRAPQLTSVDVAQLTRTVCATVAQHPDCGEAVLLDVRLEGDGPFLVDGDADLLHRALFNLTLNAVQATGPTGAVCLTLGRAADAAIGGETVIVHVRDDGPGIPDALRDRLFEPFVTGKPGGSGLGLPIVHRAAEAHGGAVLVDSDADGTTFSLVLPVARPTDAASAPPPVAATVTRAA